MEENKNKVATLIIDKFPGLALTTPETNDRDFKTAMVNFYLKKRLNDDKKISPETLEKDILEGKIDLNDDHRIFLNQLFKAFDQMEEKVKDFFICVDGFEEIAEILIYLILKNDSILNSAWKCLGQCFSYFVFSHLFERVEFLGRVLGKYLGKGKNLDQAEEKLKEKIKEFNASPYTSYQAFFDFFSPVEMKGLPEESGIDSDVVENFEEYLSEYNQPIRMKEELSKSIWNREYLGYRDQHENNKKILPELNKYFSSDISELILGYACDQGKKVFALTPKIEKILNKEDFLINQFLDQKIETLDRIQPVELLKLERKSQLKFNFPKYVLSMAVFFRTPKKENSQRNVILLGSSEDSRPLELLGFWFKGGIARNSGLFEKIFSNEVLYKGEIFVGVKFFTSPFIPFIYENKFPWSKTTVGEVLECDVNKIKLNQTQLNEIDFDHKWLCRLIFAEDINKRYYEKVIRVCCEIDRKISLDFFSSDREKVIEIIDKFSSEPRKESKPS